MKKKEFLKKAKELGIVYTDAFEGGFNEEDADTIIKICEENTTPEKLNEYVLHIDGSELFYKDKCAKCQYQNDNKNCPGYLPDCPEHNYEEFLQSHKDAILSKYPKEK